jgi:hypothetical protein
VRSGHHGVPLDGHERAPLDHPGIDDGLAGLALELAHHRVHGHRHAREHRGDVCVHESRQLLAVGAGEGADLDRRHGADLLDVDAR